MEMALGWNFGHSSTVLGWKIFSRERSHDCFPGTFWRRATATAHILKKLGPRVEEMKIGSGRMEWACH